MAQRDSFINTGFGGLFDGFEAYRSLSDDDIRGQLRSALVVFDTNVLLNLYRYNDTTRSSIIAMMVALGDRLFVPIKCLRSSGETANGRSRDH